MLQGLSINRKNLSAMLASTKARVLIITRYKGSAAMDVVIPIVLAMMPILLGRATGGDRVAEIFAANTGTSNYVAYMMIGASVFTIVSMAFWHIANWLRWEMQSGTIESIYLTPTHRVWIAGGTAIYSMIRSILTAFIAYFVGSWILGVNPLQGELFLALAFILVGAIPLYGMMLIFGALILRIKEANAIINLAQWLLNLLMGVFYPIAVLPPLARFAAMLFPPTWMTNGVRSAILGVGYFFGEWYLDFAVLWAFMIIAPLVGIWIFRKTEASVQRGEGVGKF
jgi:ABC-2 type transport system permease protein